VILNFKFGPDSNICQYRVVNYYAPCLNLGFALMQKDITKHNMVIKQDKR